LGCSPVYAYWIAINPLNNSNYEIIVPISLDSDEKIHGLINRLYIKDGYADFEIIDTLNGYGLKISGNSSVSLVSNFYETIIDDTTFIFETSKFTEFQHLSMLNHTSNENNYYWIHVNNTEGLWTTISTTVGGIRVFSDSSVLTERPKPVDDLNHYIRFKISTNKNGWQLVEGEELTYSQKDL
jgi:hypothetical protein